MYVCICVYIYIYIYMCCVNTPRRATTGSELRSRRVARPATPTINIIIIVIIIITFTNSIIIITFDVICIAIIVTSAFKGLGGVVPGLRGHEDRRA